MISTRARSGTHRSGRSSASPITSTATLPSPKPPASAVSPTPASTLELGRTPDWLAGGLADDDEWRIEWVKLYEGLDLAHAYTRHAATRLPGHLGGPRRVVLRPGARRARHRRRLGSPGAELALRLAAASRDAPRFAGPARRARRAPRRADRRRRRPPRRNLTAERNHRTLELYTLLLVALSLPDRHGPAATVALDELADNAADRHLAPTACIASAAPTTTASCCARSSARSPTPATAGPAAAARAARPGRSRCDFALHVQRPDGLTPAFSDGDEGDFRDLLAFGADLFDRDDLRWAPPAASSARRPSPRRDVPGRRLPTCSAADGATAAPIRATSVSC